MLDQSAGSALQGGPKQRSRIVSGENEELYALEGVRSSTVQQIKAPAPNWLRISYCEGQTPAVSTSDGISERHNKLVPI